MIGVSFLSFYRQEVFAVANETLEDILRGYSKEGDLYERLEGGSLRCVACGHRCVIRDGRVGICRVRFNKDGKLLVPYGYVGGIQCDPIEKKPFFHAYPGTNALSFGMLGCDFHCGYCQNWITSQALRDPDSVAPPEVVSGEHLVELARRYRARTVASTYNEPLITSEWAVHVFKGARKAGFATAYISNGNGTPEVLDYIRPWVDLYKIDLKGFNDRHYRELGGVLDNVLATIRQVYEKGFWLEVVTLLVPGFNDSDEEITQIAEFLASISNDIPWHVTAFHKDYRMTDPDNTSVETLLRAARIGEKAGLHYVYAGNLPGQVGEYENTRCPACRETLIARFGFRILSNRLKDGTCPSCQTKIPGVWN